MSLSWTPAGVSRRRLAHAVGLLVLVVVVGLFVASSVPQVVGADQAYVVRSDSMSPSIKAGAVVFVSSVPAEQVDVGDVITYDSSAAGTSPKVTHRVVEILESDDGPQFRTKGDANDAPDAGLIGASDLVGRVGFHVPLIGYGISIAGTRLGLIAFVVVPAVALVALELWDLATADDSAGDRR